MTGSWSGLGPGPDLGLGLGSRKSGPEGIPDTTNGPSMPRKRSPEHSYQRLLSTITEIYRERIAEVEHLHSTTHKGSADYILR